MKMNGMVQQSLIKTWFGFVLSIVNEKRLAHHVCEPFMNTSICQELIALTAARRPST